MAAVARSRPNILVTGTPGTGKTTFSAALSESTNLRHINIGDLVKEKNLHDGWDDKFDCYIINEDLVSTLFYSIPICVLFLFLELYDRSGCCVVILERFCWRVYKLMMT